MKNNKFFYISDCVNFTLPFRAGDLVKINNWGGIYNNFTKANDMLLGENNTPYYDYELGCKSPRNRIFKIIGFALHPFCDVVVFAVKDIENKTAIISHFSLIPFLTYPLNKGENRTIKLDKIK